MARMGVAFAAAPRPFVLLRAGLPVWDRPKRWYHPLDRGDVAQLGERGVRNAEVGSSILLVSTTPIPKGRLHAGPFSFRGWRLHSLFACQVINNSLVAEADCKLEAVASHSVAFLRVTPVADQ